MKGLILAGGFGTRLRPLTFTGNKHTLPVANKPIILYGLEHLIDAGIEEIGIVLGPLKEGIVDIVNSIPDLNAEITFIEQLEPKGLAHAISVSKDFLGDEPFVMYLGDNLLKEGAKPMIRIFEEQDSDCVIGVMEVEDPSRFGVVVFDEGKIEKLVEKPKERISNWALIGVYVFNSKVFSAISRIKPSWRNELEITDAIQVLIEDKAKVDYHAVQGWWKDTGRPEDLLEANQLVLESLESNVRGRVEPGVQISSRVDIGEGTHILSRTTIRGPAIIGRNCELGPNTYIGPYTSIGDNVKIRNSEVENSIVMDNVVIDCGKKIVDSLVGSGAHIVSADHGLPRGNRLILGDMSYVSL